MSYRTYRFCPGCGVKFTGPDDKPCYPYDNWFPENPDDPPRIRCLTCNETFPVDPPVNPKPRTFNNLSEALAYFQTEYEAGRYKPPNDPLWDFVLSDWKADGTSEYPTPDRIAELREKYTQFTIPYTAVEIHNDVNELLDMLEAKEKKFSRHATAGKMALAELERQNRRLLNDLSEAGDEIERLKNVPKT